jgi:hypothetical protein
MEKKYIVCEHELHELLKVCSSCGAEVDLETLKEEGTFLKVAQVNDYICFLWH